MSDQLDLFSEPLFSSNKKIRLIETFAGVGSQAMALERMGVDFEHHYVCEFDKYAIASYNAIHGTNFPVSDITKTHAEDLKITERDKYLYILTYSFPCQSLSVAGKQEGMKKGSGTRSGLLWEIERILTECGENLPHVLMMENVNQVHSKKNIEDFSLWIKFLDSLGYSSFYQDLNSKFYGVPQNRDRCFMISILGNYAYEFPKEIPLEFVMADILQEDVPEKFFISNEKADKLIEQLIAEKKIEA